MHCGERAGYRGDSSTQALDIAVRREPWQVLEQGHDRASLPLALHHLVLTLLRVWGGGRAAPLSWPVA